jgi:starch synthase
MLPHLDETPDITCFGTIESAPDAVYYSYHGRIAWQKGLDVLEKAARVVLAHSDNARFIILGQGDPTLESLLIGMSVRYPGRFVYIRGYERSLARMAVAVSDFLVLPSAFEPCGLEDYIAQIFGTIPVAHAVGGLQKITNGKNGFLYGTHESNEPARLASLLLELAEPLANSRGKGMRSVSAYLEMIRFAARHVRDECNWDRIIRDSWIPLYEKTKQSNA